MFWRGFIMASTETDSHGSAKCARAIERFYTAIYVIAASSNRGAATLTAERPGDRVIAHDAADGLAQAAFQDRTPRNESELAGLLDDGKLAARQFDSAHVGALDALAGFGLGVPKAKLL